jgi:hypothetical protein
MSALIRWTLPLVAYLCVGTVITALLGYGYLRHNGALSDETMFRIVALVQGVDLDEIAHEGQAAVETVPPEEPSFAEQQAAIQTATLHFDAKQKQLAQSLSNFDYQLKAVSEATERYKQLQSVVEKYFKEQLNKLADADLAAVRTQLETMDPKKQGKPILIKYIKAGEIETVILLLGSMKERARRELIRKFDTEEDLEMLFQVQQHMLNDNPAMAVINEQLKAFNQLKAEEK